MTENLSPAPGIANSTSDLPNLPQTPQPQTAAVSSGETEGGGGGSGGFGVVVVFPAFNLQTGHFFLIRPEVFVRGMCGISHIYSPS